ncbi:hypothetical protein QZH41_010949, partial [Actinostola sp. cb2023]
MTENDELNNVKYEPVGCYDDGGSRPLPVLLANLRRFIKWADLNRTIDACARIASIKGYTYFAVQFYGECWSGPNAESTYDDKGPSKHCVVGVGKAWTNFVYRINKGILTVEEQNDIPEATDLTLDTQERLKEYEPVGCYLDKGVKPRPLPLLLANLRSSIDWTNLNKTIRACALLAQIKGYSYFGIQFWGECWSGATAGQTYNKDGSSKECAVGAGMAGDNNCCPTNNSFHRNDYRPTNNGFHRNDYRPTNNGFTDHVA